MEVCKSPMPKCDLSSVNTFLKTPQGPQNNKPSPSNKPLPETSAALARCFVSASGLEIQRSREVQEAEKWKPKYTKSSISNLSSKFEVS
ncbi:uncharacterized protein LOC143039202 isoform X2 [Oratosquilla oratoria]|uniref:uncharacterized protein LOC143039202 isoform X2 n=1 Tax=Oratosquilla oratoria TaxID=337810 RepID=UPI003F75E8D4